MSPRIKSSLYFGGYFAALGLYVPFFNTYLKEIGLTGTEIGRIAMVIPMVQLIFVSPGSAFADKINQRRNMLTLMIIGMSTTFFFGQFPTTFWGVISFYAIYGIFFGLAFSLANGIISNMAEKHGFTFGAARVWGSIGFSIMSGLGGLIFGQFGLIYLFVLVSILLWVPVIMSRTLEEPPAQKPGEGTPPLITVIQKGKLLGLLIPWGFMMFGFGAVLSFEGIAIRDMGGTEFVIGLTLAVVAASELPFMPNVVRFIDRFGGRQTLMFAYLFLASSFFAYSFATEAWMMPLAGLLRGAGFGVAMPAVVTLIARRVPSQWAATGQGLVIMTNAVVHTIANLVGGPIYDAFGASTLFFICGVSVLIAAVITGFGAEQAQPVTARVSGD